VDQVLADIVTPERYSDYVEAVSKAVSSTLERERERERDPSDQLQSRT